MTTGQFIITQAVCLWYHNETTGVMIGVKALYWTFRYHFGTVCFGSLVLTLTNGLRIICKYILVKAPAPAALEGVHRIPRAIFGCLINLAEKMVKYFTSQVLTQVALTSDNFCASSCRTAKIMDLSLFRFEAICEILTFLGKILISVVTTIISHKLLFYKGWTTSLNTTGHVPLITLAIIFASAWCITSVFVLIWEISSDAIVNLQTISKHNGQSRYSEEKLGKDFSNSLENLDQSGLSYV
jgi:choline transporter-like protein 2/4/5